LTFGLKLVSRREADAEADLEFHARARFD